MFFAGEDELAIHTVASAAYRLIADLKAKRGRDEAADSYLTAIFYAVRNYRKGTLPDSIAQDPIAMKSIREMADRLPIHESLATKDLAASSISSDASREFWRGRNAISNFLKHADRDDSSHISLDDVDNLALLIQACHSYLDLTKDNLGREGFVLWVYFCVTNGFKAEMPKKFRKYASKLEELDPNERITFCSEWIRQVKRD